MKTPMCCIEHWSLTYGLIFINVVTLLEPSKVQSDSCFIWRQGIPTLYSKAIQIQLVNLLAYLFTDRIQDVCLLARKLHERAFFPI